MNRKLAPLVLLLLSTAQLFGQLKIAWLSDTHIGFPTGAPDLQAVVRDINAMKSELSVAVISGDIAEKGKNEELRLAKSILDSLQLPYLIVPGNHDTKWSESGGMMFKILFGDDKVVRDVGDYRFIGLNSGIPLRGGGGHFAPQDLRWLDSVLAVTAPSSKIIFFCHHQPDGNEIDNSSDLLDRLKTRDVRFIGVGHGHANRKYDFAGIEGVMFRSILSRNALPAYNIVELRDDSIFVSKKDVGEVAGSPWHQFANRKSIFARGRPFRDELARSSNVKVAWEYNAGVTIGTQAATDGRDVIVVDAGGNVTSLRLSNGQVNWKVRVSDATIFSTAALSNDKAILGSSDGLIRALSLRNGSTVWVYPTEGAVLSSPLLHNGVIYVGASDGRFRAINEATGELVWEYEGIGENVETKPIFSDGKIIFGSWDGYLYALGASNGALHWKWIADKPNFYYAPAACWPVASDGKVFVAAPDKFTSAIDVRTGQTFWRTAAFPVWESIGISADGSRLYIRGLTDTLYCVSATANEPDLLWKVDCKYGFDANPSMPIEKDGVIFFGSKKGMPTPSTRPPTHSGGNSIRGMVAQIHLRPSATLK